MSSSKSFENVRSDDDDDQQHKTNSNDDGKGFAFIDKPSRRTSTTTGFSENSSKSDYKSRPPSSPIERRCDRIYSSLKNDLNRETCLLLGPDLCSDCLEIRQKDHLSSELLSSHLIQQRLKKHSLKRFLPNDPHLNDQQIEQIFSNYQHHLEKLSSNSSEDILTDEQYFHHLSTSISQNSHSTPFYFQHFQDLTEKYRQNRYPRLLISETPVPQSSNPIFQQSNAEKFSISPKYSQMKRSSTKVYPLRSDAPCFISPKKSEQFYSEHRYPSNSSPPLLIQNIQQMKRNQSHLQTNKSYHSIHKHSLIASKIPSN